LKKKSRHWNADEKIRLLRLHLIEKQAIFKICEEASLSTPQFYPWQEQLFATGSAALASTRISECDQEHDRIQKLKSTLPRSSPNFSHGAHRPQDKSLRTSEGSLGRAGQAA
jgi:transposase-like protein